MNVNDLNGTHIGKRITVTRKTDTFDGEISGQLLTVEHEAVTVDERRLCDPPDMRPVVSRVAHTLRIDEFEGRVSGEATVEVHE